MLGCRWDANWRFVAMRSAAMLAYVATLDRECDLTSPHAPVARVVVPIERREQQQGCADPEEGEQRASRWPTHGERCVLRRGQPREAEGREPPIPRLRCACCDRAAPPRRPRGAGKVRRRRGRQLSAAEQRARTVDASRAQGRDLVVGVHARSPISDVLAVFCASPACKWTCAEASATSESSIDEGRSAKLSATTSCCWPPDSRKPESSRSRRHGGDGRWSNGTPRRRHCP